MKNELVFLGTGSSTGVPVIGCTCAVCKSSDRRDRRSRVSVLIRNESEAHLIDCSPDFRQQALDNDVRRLDSIFITHSHNDHINGIDDVRIFNFLQKGNIPLYADSATIDDIRKRFSYVFEKTQAAGGKPELALHRISEFEKIQSGNMRITPLPISHGSLRIMGFLINEQIAYITDCSGIPKETHPYLEGVDTLILGAVRDRPHPTHFSFSEALEWVQKLKPRRAFFTHMNHDLSHQELTERFQGQVEIPVDGLAIPLQD